MALGPIVDQVRLLVENGYREVVLTGVDITSWGADLPGRPSLGQLVRRLLAAVQRAVGGGQVEWPRRRHGADLGVRHAAPQRMQQRARHDGVAEPVGQPHQDAPRPGGRPPPLSSFALFALFAFLRFEPFFAMASPRMRRRKGRPRGQYTATGGTGASRAPRSGR